MKIDEAWHAKNKMPKNPTIQQRVAWHIDHSKHCKCQEIPPKIKVLIDSGK